MYDSEFDGVEDVYVSIVGSRANVSALLHSYVVARGRDLNTSQKAARFRVERMETRRTRLTISPLFVSMTSIVSCIPAIRISEVALEVKLMHRRSLMSSALSVLRILSATRSRASPGS